MKKSLLTFVFCVCTALMGAQTSRIYTDNLVVSIDGESTEPQTAEIIMEPVDEHTCNVSLKNFTLGSGADVMYVGNIYVPGVKMEVGEGCTLLSSEQTIQITPGDDDSQSWIGPMLGDVPLVLRGKCTDAVLYCTIDIDMSETLEQVIYVQFGADFEPVAPASRVYTDNLVVSIDGESTEPQTAEIIMEPVDEHTCNVSLKNFTLGSGADVLYVGNIYVPGVKMEAGEGCTLLSSEQTIQITPGDDDLQSWIGPMLGDVPLVLRGKCTDTVLYCTIDIDMSESLEQVIYVQFGEESRLDGVRNVRSAEGLTDVYTLQGVRVRSAVPASAALNGLQRGIYVVNGKLINKTR